MTIDKDTPLLWGEVFGFCGSPPTDYHGPIGPTGKAFYPQGNVLCNEAVLHFVVHCCGCGARDEIAFNFPFREGPPTAEQQRQRVINWRRHHEAASPSCLSSTIDILHPDEGPPITEEIARQPVIDGSCPEEKPAGSWRDREPLL